MDAQTTGTRSATLAALVASIAHLELEAGCHPEELLDAPELLAGLAENRFLAAGTECRPACSTRSSRERSPRAESRQFSGAAAPSARRAARRRGALT